MLLKIKITSLNLGSTFFYTNKMKFAFFIRVTCTNKRPLYHVAPDSHDYNPATQAFPSLKIWILVFIPELLLF